MMNDPALEQSSKRDDPTYLRWRNWLGPVAAIGIVGTLWTLHQAHWRFLSDDAYISFRYARNLAEYGLAVYNVSPPEFVEGYTNPLWVALLAVITTFTKRMPDQVAPSATMLGSLMCLVAVSFIWINLGARHQLGWVAEENRSRLSPLRRSLWSILPCLPLVASPNFMVWAHGGLETSLATAFGLFSLCGALWGRWNLAGALLAAAALTRLDSLAWVGAGLLMIRLADLPRVRDRALWRYVSRRDLFAISCIVLPIACHFLWRRYYYGEWLPNTWLVKRHGTLLRDTWGVEYLRLWLRDLHLIWAIPLLAMLRWRHLVLAGPIVTILVYGWWVGGDFMAYQRFYLPATVLVVPLVLWLSTDVLAVLGSRFPGVKSGTAGWLPSHRECQAVGVVLVGLCIMGLLFTELAGRIEKDRREGWLDGRWEGVTSMDSFSRIRLEAGRAMAKEIDASSWVSVGAAGAFPYGSRFSAFDIYGLVDPDVARNAVPRTTERTRPGHQLTASVEHIRQRDPKLLCHIGWVARNRPGDVELRRRIRGGGEYHWRCVAVGPLPAIRPGDGPIARHHYCCVEPGP